VKYEITGSKLAARSGLDAAACGDCGLGGVAAAIFIKKELEF